MELKKGMTIKLVSYRNPWWNQEGHMDKFCGKIVTIYKVYNNNFKIKNNSTGKCEI